MANRGRALDGDSMRCRRSPRPSRYLASQACNSPGDVVSIDDVRGRGIDQIEAVAPRDPQHPDGAGRVGGQLLAGDLAEHVELPDAAVTDAYRVAVLDSLARR